MIKGSEIGKADFPIEPLLLDRCSPRAMSGEEISAGRIDATLRSSALGAILIQRSNGVLFMLVAGPSIGKHFLSYWSTLTNRGQKMPPPSLSLFLERNLITTTNHRSHIPTIVAQPWENFALQGFQQGLVAHGMEGFDYDRARTELLIPDEFQVEAMAAVGKVGAKEMLPEKLRARESPNDRRQISESIFEGPFQSAK